LNENPDIDQISVKNFTKSKHLKKIFRLGRSLRAERPNIFLAAAGTDPLVGSIIAFLSGAKIRIGENWKGRGFLYTHYLNVNYNVTEKDQNINLIKQLNIPAKQSLPKIYLTDFEKEAAENWLFSIKKNVEAKILGIHPGSGKGQSWKRWNINNFIKVGKTIAKQKKAIVVFFFGPDDRNLRNKAEKELLGSSIIINGNDGIRETAAKISCCDIFFSNDSGLRQIAVALNINTIGIFGPTSIKKNFLYDEKHKIIHDKSVYCSPCHYTKWWLNCNGKRPCLNRISVKIALDCINNLL
jgi:ADP-heptose:LPS heptosyltransferase